MAFPIGGVGKAGSYVVLGQVVVIVQNFLLGHTSGKTVEYVVNGYPKPSDARLAAAFARFYGDEVMIVDGHGFNPGLMAFK